jgi:hypothetical protein
LCSCASPQAIAKIICTDVAIVAINRQTNTEAILTVVSDGAGITIDTFAFGKQVVCTSIFIFTGIQRTGVAIVAQFQIFTIDQQRFVHLAITVVVNAVTGLFGRFFSVTFG